VPQGDRGCRNRCSALRVGEQTFDAKALEQREKLGRDQKGDRPLRVEPPPHVRFRKALASGSVTLALVAATELGALALEDAFELTLLFVTREPHRYGRSAAKWWARFVIERGPFELSEAALLVALLAALPAQPTAAARGLEALFEQRGEDKLAEEVRRWQVERMPSR
jgi:hypothetical protein